MPANPTAVVGAFLLERSLRTKYLKTYLVYPLPNVPASEQKPVATLWVVSTPDVPEEWRILCADCPPIPGTGRQETRGSGYTTRERALRHIARHRASHK